MSFEKFNSIGQALDTFGLPFVQEYKFHPSRKWRFDYAIPKIGVAIEYEGMSKNKKSRHATITGYAGDCEKYNEAALLGWLVFRFTALNEQNMIKVLSALKNWEAEFEKKNQKM